MKAYQNGFWIWNTDPKRLAQIFYRDMRGEDSFAIEMMYAALDNKDKEFELARGTKKEKTRAELETEEALEEEFIW